MKPNAWLKSLKTNFSAIASRPSTSRQPVKPASAALRAAPSSLVICVSPCPCLRENNRHANANAMDWTEAHAPTLDEIERLAVEGFASLPEEFRALTGD